MPPRPNLKQLEEEAARLRRLRSWVGPRPRSMPEMTSECETGRHSLCPGGPPQKGKIGILCLCPHHQEAQ